jgi:asparagine synthetase B (glutamine-hydrolysing)
MLGICSQYYYKEKHLISIQTLKRMNDTITHRGPEKEEYHNRISSTRI